MSRKRWGCLAAALAVATAAAACGGGDSSSGGTNAAAGEGTGAPGGDEVSVEVAVVRIDTLSTTIRAVGSLEADARVEVKPETDGHVTGIRFVEGASVEKGDVLVRLDHQENRARVEAAEARLSSAAAREENLSRQVERNDSLLAQGAISRQAFDDIRTRHAEAEAALHEARANLSLARVELENATIRAPFDGRTGARRFDLGDFVSTGEPLFTLVDDDPLEIRFSVPERYLGRLERGRRVSVGVRSVPEREFRGRVDFVSPYVDESNRTVELRARIPNPRAELRPGQFANVTLVLEERPAPVVPEAAVLSRPEGGVVYRVKRGEAERTPVELGQREVGIVEIVSGLRADDTVIVAGQQKVQDGTRVNALPEAEAGSAAPGEPSGTGSATPDSRGASRAAARGSAIGSSGS